MDIKDSRPTPAEILERSETLKTVVQALNQLDVNEKTIVVLKDVEDKSYEEISRILDIKVGTVKSQLSRARHHLRDIYQKMQRRLV